MDVKEIVPLVTRAEAVLEKLGITSVGHIFIALSPDPKAQVRLTIGVFFRAFAGRYVRTEMRSSSKEWHIDFDGVHFDAVEYANHTPCATTEVRLPGEPVAA